MSKYTGKTITVNRSAQEIADRFADLSQLQSVVDTLPESEKAKFGNISFSQQSIIIENPQAGRIQFEITERTPSKIALRAVGMPIPLNMDLNLKAISDSDTEMAAAVELQIPALLKPLIAPKLQKAVDMLTDVMAKIASK